MARYLIQETVTSQAVAVLMKDPQDSTEAARPVFESVGGKLEHYYAARNENTVNIIGDIPDEDSLAAILWSFQGGGGPISIKATPLMTATEAVDMLRRAGSEDDNPLDECPLAPPVPVGGEAYPVNGVSVIAPWVAVALLASAVGWLALRCRGACS